MMGFQNSFSGGMVDAGVLRQLGNQMCRNKIAELPQKRELSRRWLALSLVFHPPPCGRVQTRKPTLFLPTIFNPVGLL
jgi:hypothetical protein